jgi:hypothetical protein
MKKIMKLSLFALIVVLGLSSCKKNNLVVDKDPIVAPPALAEFLLASFTPKSYYVKPLGTVAYAIPVGVTSVSSVDRTVQFSYTSSTGAVMGTHFTAPTSVVIKAGKALDSVRILGTYSEYAGGRVDSVKVKITSGAVAAFSGKDSIVLVIQRYCEVILGDLSGDYTDTNEYTAAGAFSYGPYTTSLTSLVSTGATSATGKLVNLYDDGWNDIDCTIDWTNPSNFKIAIPLQATGKAYGGATATSVRTSSTKASTFSACDRSFSIYIDLVNAATGVVTTAGYQFKLK